MDNPHSLAKLRRLAEIRREMRKYNRLRSDFIGNWRKRDKTAAMISELNEEITKHMKERRRIYEAAVKLKKDMDEIIETRKELQSMADKHERELDETRAMLEPKRIKLNEIGAQFGLAPIPPPDQEIDREIAKYLEERREKWRETGVIDPDESTGKAVTTGSSTPASIKARAPASSPRSKNATAEGSGSRKKRRHA